MKSRLGYIVFGIGILCLICSAALLDQAYKRTSYSNYTLRVEYQKLPGDDESIKTWLSQQPGFRSTTVSREGNKVLFDITFTPLPPDILGKLMKQCEDNGYQVRREGAG